MTAMYECLTPGQPAPDLNGVIDREHVRARMYGGIVTGDI